MKSQGAPLYKRRVVGDAHNFCTVNRVFLTLNVVQETSSTILRSLWFNLQVSQINYNHPKNREIRVIAIILPNL